MNRLLELYRKNRMMISYLFFGVLTTLVNMVVYGLLYDMAGLSNLISTVIAWAAAVLFAYVTNKLLVFQSRGQGASRAWKEFVMFVSCRLLTGVLDVAIMVAAVDWLAMNGMVWKFISNVIVTVLNYFASKLLIFKKSN